MSLKTIKDYIRWGASEFQRAELHYGHGTDNALDDALMLVLHALNLDHSLPQTYFDTRLTKTEKKTIKQLFKKRIKSRQPAAYLTGMAYFCGLPFYVNKHVLVPRSPIAELIQNQFKPWLEDLNPHRILDLCTGSGCIAIATAYAFPDTSIDAIDLSTDALDIAALNADFHHCTEQVQLIHSDLFSALTDQKYDLIVSNPPYVSEDEMNSLPAEFHQEPRMGLAAGDDGLILVDKILAEAANYLTNDGVLIVEVGYSEDTLVKKYPKIPFLWLNFEQGGQGVFLLTASQLKKVQ